MLKKSLILFLIVLIFISLVFSRKKNNKSNFGLGFAISPTVPLYKLSLYGISKGGMGFELAAVTNSKWKDKEDNYYDSIDNVTAEETFGDEQLSTATGKTLIFGNIIFRISSKLFVYGGPGYGTSQKFNEYDDPTHILGEHGKYWVEADEKGDSWLTIDAGLKFLAAENFGFELGYIAKPSAVMFGANLNLKY
jgi:hypothetical protein